MVRKLRTEGKSAPGVGVPTEKWQGPRRFGVVVGCAFLLIAAILALRHHAGAAFLVCGGVGCGLFLCGWLAPALLSPLERAWTRVAMALGWINTRLLLCLAFFLLFTPISLLIRLFRRDLLHRRFDPRLKSYWNERPPAATNPDHYKRQF